MGDYIIVIVKEQNITDFQTKYRIFGTICDKQTTVQSKTRKI